MLTITEVLPVDFNSTAFTHLKVSDHNPLLTQEVEVAREIRHPTTARKCERLCCVSLALRLLHFSGALIIFAFPRCLDFGVRVTDFPRIKQQPRTSHQIPGKLCRPTAFQDVAIFLTNIPTGNITRLIRSARHDDRTQPVPPAYLTKQILFRNEPRRNNVNSCHLARISELDFNLAVFLYQPGNMQRGHLGKT